MSGSWLGPTTGQGMLFISPPREPEAILRSSSNVTYGAFSSVPVAVCGSGLERPR